VAALPRRRDLEPQRAPVGDADGELGRLADDEHARYFGTELADTSLTPGPNARLGTTTFAEWLALHRR